MYAIQEVVRRAAARWTDYYTAQQNSTLKTVVLKQLTAGVATLRTSVAHGFTAGQTIGVRLSPADAVFDTAEAKLTNVTVTDLLFAKVSPDVPAIVSGGNIWQSYIGERVFAEGNDILSREDVGQFPCLVYSMQDDSFDSCGRDSAVIRLDVTIRNFDKALMGKILRGMQSAVTPRLMLVEQLAAGLKTRIAMFRKTSEADDIFDDKTNTYRLRSVWSAKYVEEP